MERENILKAAGYKVESIWECEWYEIKKPMSNTKRKN
jgi:G:T-mismatch repair DNA endonuclease (very short patch repair protein)